MGSHKSIGRHLFRASDIHWCGHNYMYRFGAVQGAIVQLGLRNAMNEFTTQNHHLWLTRSTDTLRPVIFHANLRISATTSSVSWKMTCPPFSRYASAFEACG
jgi:hypothetical protein